LFAPLVIASLPAFIIMLAALLSLGILTLLLSMVAGTQRIYAAQTRLNPFHDYSAIWPGQALNMNGARNHAQIEGRVTCAAGALPDTVIRSPALPGANPAEDRLSCAALLRDPYVYEASVSIHHNRVQELHFLAQDLDLDTLYLYWGAPDVIAYDATLQQFQLEWRYDSYTAAAWAGANQQVSQVQLTSA
jgi:hypothetical protein